MAGQGVHAGHARGVRPRAGDRDEFDVMHAVRHRDHLPPLMRGIGFLLVLMASVIGGVMEQRVQRDLQARAMQARTQLDAIAANAPDGDGGKAAIAREIRLLRAQLQADDFGHRVLENRAFQVLGTLGSLLVALSFLVEARAKWPRRAPRPPAERPDLAMPGGDAAGSMRPSGRDAGEPS